MPSCTRAAPPATLETTGRAAAASALQRGGADPADACRADCVDALQEQEREPEPAPEGDEDEEAVPGRSVTEHLMWCGARPGASCVDHRAARRGVRSALRTRALSQACACLCLPRLLFGVLCAVALSLLLGECLARRALLPPTPAHTRRPVPPPTPPPMRA